MGHAPARLADLYGDAPLRRIAFACCRGGRPGELGTGLAAVHRALRLIRLRLARRFAAAGAWTTRVLDAGAPASPWHRIDLDLDLPPGTGVIVETVSSDDRAALTGAALDALPPPPESETVAEPGDDDLPPPVRWSTLRDAEGRVLAFTGAAPLAAGARFRHDAGRAAATLRELLVPSPPGRFLRVRVRLVVQVVASKDGEIQTGHETPGMLGGYELFRDFPPEEAGRVAAAQALTMLEARPAPSGPMAVVIANGTGGVLFHEACGHSLEADAVYKKASVFAGKLGEKVASPLVNAYDDATLVRRVLAYFTPHWRPMLAVVLAMPADGRAVCLDMNEEWTGIARRYWSKSGVADRIDLRLGPALASLDAMLAAGEAGRHDLAFIDADKANYDAYYERCLALVRPGGAIALDNMLWNGAVADPAKQDEDTAALRALNRKIRDDRRVACSLVPIGDGLMLCRKRP